MNFVSYDFLFPNFGFVSNIPYTHHDAQRLPHDFLFRSFGFVLKFWICFEHFTRTSSLNAHPMIFYFRVLGLLSSFSFVGLIRPDDLCKSSAPEIYSSTFGEIFSKFFEVQLLLQFRFWDINEKMEDFSDFFRIYQYFVCSILQKYNSGIDNGIILMRI